MKKILTLICLALCGTVILDAQNLQEDKVTYQYTRLPMTPLDKSVKTYKFVVSTPYPSSGDNIRQRALAKYQQDSMDYPRKVEEAKQKYEQDMAQYEVDVQTAKDNYELESQKFQELTLVERMAMDESQKPKLRMPSKPSYREPYPPNYVEPSLANTIIFNPEVLANSYLNLQGYEKGDNGVLFTVNMVSFEYIDPERKVKETKELNTKTGQTETKRVVTYDTRYKFPTNLKIEANGKILSNTIFAPTAEYTLLTTSNPPNRQNLEKQTVEDVMVLINDSMNNLYGFSKIDVNTVVGYVKNNKGEYDDLEEAKELALSGYKALGFEREKGVEDLKKAIGMWNKALEGSDLEDKKARIDKKVTTMIYQNLIEALIITDQLTAAEEALKKLKSIDMNNSDEKRYDALKAFHEDEYRRARANM